MNTALPRVTPVADRDRHRACRLAHAFGASIAAALALLVTAATQFRVQPVPLPVLLTAGSAVAATAGILADLAVRPARVLTGEGWLAVSRLGRSWRVRTDRLVDLSANPRVAGCILLADEDGNTAEIEVRCLVRNPLIWQLIARGVGSSRRRGSLDLSGPKGRLWDSVTREMDQAQQQALAAIDFEPAWLTSD
jgi:hypothetical protein